MYIRTVLTTFSTFIIQNFINNPRASEAISAQDLSLTHITTDPRNRSPASPQPSQSLDQDILAPSILQGSPHRCLKIWRIAYRSTITILILSILVVLSILLFSSGLPPSQSNSQGWTVTSTIVPSHTTSLQIPLTTAKRASMRPESRSSQDPSQPAFNSSAIRSGSYIVNPPTILVSTTSTPIPEASQSRALSSYPLTRVVVSAVAATSPIPASTSPASSRKTSIVFGAIGPVKTYMREGTTTTCSRLSGTGCPGDRCYSNTCLDRLPCWKGRCCTSGCATGWECTKSCVSKMMCVTATGNSIGICRYSA